VHPRPRFAILFAYLTGVITLCAYWFKLWIIPQPHRYHLEMDMAFWLAAALLAGQVVNLPQVCSPRRGRTILAVALALSIPVALREHRLAQANEKPIAIRSTAEYEIAHWLSQQTPQRVFAPGTIGFWMQTFSDTPMLTGGFDNGIRNTFLQDIIYQIYAGDRQDIMLAWLKAFGVGAVVGDAPGSREFYHPYAHPEKFAGLPEIWRDGAEVIYSVPRRRASLAHAMLVSDLVQQRPPAYYIKPLEPYLAALDDPSLPDADFRWTGTGAAVITGNLEPRHILSVQITWDKGWSARVGGQPRGVWQDKLGQMAVAPLCSGPCTVELEYDGGIEQQAARWLSAAALLAGLASMFFRRTSFPKEVSS
jgi:hypothetical protein